MDNWQIYHNDQLKMAVANPIHFLVAMSHQERKEDNACTGRNTQVFHVLNFWWPR
jgi:hypothetical protein